MCMFITDTFEEKAQHLIRIMGRETAKRYVDINISNFDDEIFIHQRIRTKEYWQEVKTYLK